MCPRQKSIEKVNIARFYWKKFHLHIILKQEWNQPIYDQKVHKDEVEESSRELLDWFGMRYKEGTVTQDTQSEKKMLTTKKTLSSYESSELGNMTRFFSFLFISHLVVGDL